MSWPRAFKCSAKLYLAAAIVGGLGLVSSDLQAQVTQSVSITGTVLAQSPTNAITIKAALRSEITPAFLLKQLALDEFAAGNYPTNIFPAGTRLVYNAELGFQVVDRHTNSLVDISNLLSLQTNGAGNVTYSTVFGIWSSQYNFQLLTLCYNTNAPAGQMHFAVTGLATTTFKTSRLNAKELYTEINSFRFQDGTGEGANAEGVPIVLTAFTITATGSARVNFADNPGGL